MQPSRSFLTLSVPRVVAPMRRRCDAYRASGPGRSRWFWCSWPFSQAKRRGSGQQHCFGHPEADAKARRMMHVGVIDYQDWWTGMVFWNISLSFSCFSFPFPWASRLSTLATPHPHAEGRRPPCPRRRAKWRPSPTEVRKKEGRSGMRENLEDGRDEGIVIPCVPESPARATLNSPDKVHSPRSSVCAGWALPLPISWTHRGDREGSKG